MGGRKEGEEKERGREEERNIKSIYSDLIKTP